MRMGDGRGGPISEINVTPLVDIMLVLLIIMMLVAPLLDGTPVAKADRDASYRAVMTVMDRLHDAHVDNVGLITRTPPAPGEPQRGDL